MKWDRKMISKEMWIKIRSMFAKGVKVSDIAREINFDRKIYLWDSRRYLNKKFQEIAKKGGIN
jgi:hypothetical protein